MQKFFYHISDRDIIVNIMCIRDEIKILMSDNKIITKYSLSFVSDPLPKTKTEVTKSYHFCSQCE